MLGTTWENSTYLANVTKHLLLGSLAQNMWKRRLPTKLLIYLNEVDLEGDDLVLAAGKIIRHVQLKASPVGSGRRSVDVNIGLGRQPSGCVVWVYYKPETLELVEFLYFGSSVAGDPLPSFDQYPVARNPRRNAQGERTARKNARLIPKKDFKKVGSVGKLVDLLFGTQQA